MLKETKPWGLRGMSYFQPRPPRDSGFQSSPVSKAEGQNWKLAPNPNCCGLQGISRNSTSGFLLTVLYSEGWPNRLLLEAARRKQDILKYVIKVNSCSEGAFKISLSFFQAIPSFPGRPNFCEPPLWSPHPPPKGTQLFLAVPPAGMHKEHSVWVP